MDTFLLCVIVLILMTRAHPLPAVGPEDATIRAVATQLPRVQPKLIDSARSVYFYGRPVSSGQQCLTYIVRLQYRREDLIVDRVKTMTPPPDANALAAYDYVFSFHGPDMFRVKPDS